MSTQAMIHTENLGRKYGRRWVVRELNLEVPKGAVYGFLGLNGAGKSTTIRMLMGLIRRHSGSATIMGLDPAKDDVALKQQVGYVAEAPAFYDWMRVDEICRFVATYRKGRWSWPKAEELISRFRIPRDVRMKNLSKGQRAKTALILAMAFDPEVLILDEPTSGLDPVARREFVEGVLGEYQDDGKTIFVSSHLVNELSGLVDHVGILHEGRLLLSQRSDEFMDSVRKVKLTFEEAAPKKIQCDGLLKAHSDGRHAVVSVYDFSEDKTLEQLRSLKPSSIDVERLNLEDAFVEYIGGAERGEI